MLPLPAPPSSPRLPALARAIALACWFSAAGCTFKPHIPDSILTCSTNHDCPQGFACNTAVNRCCRPGACDEAGGPDTDSARAKPDAGRADASSDGTPADAGLDGAADAERASPRATDAAAGETGGHPTAALLTCTGTTPVPAPEPGRQAFCTIVARDSEVGLAIHSMIPGDAVSTRTYGVCTAPLPLGSETGDPGSGGRPLTAPTTEALVALVGQYQKLCAEHAARVVGAAAGSWARQASNRALVEERFRAGTGLDLDVLTPAEEFSQVYFGLTRNRRGLAVLMQDGPTPEIVSSAKAATTLSRDSLALSFDDVDGMFMTNASYRSFDDARRALRDRLGKGLGQGTTGLRSAIASKGLESGILVGPAGATVALALDGQLRDARGTWSGVPEFEMKRDAATVTPSPYGRIFGTAPFVPRQVDAFFKSVDAAQWLQLRQEPIRSAYGGEVLYITTLLDLLADEVKATEFVFVFAHPHLGYLFAKLLPPPI
jgi:hypothetical protein